MRHARSLAGMAVVALMALSGCADDRPAQGPVANSLGVVEQGDLCNELSPAELSDITGGSFQAGETTPAQPGRDDGCFAPSVSTGLVVTVEVWTDHDDLEDDIVRFGSPAAATSTNELTVAGSPGLSAAAEIDGRQMSDLVVHVDDRVLVVLVQQYAAMAEGATPEDGLEHAVAIAETVLKPS